MATSSLAWWTFFMIKVRFSLSSWGTVSICACNICTTFLRLLSCEQKLPSVEELRFSDTKINYTLRLGQRSSPCCLQIFFRTVAQMFKSFAASFIGLWKCWAICAEELLESMKKGKIWNEVRTVSICVFPFARARASLFAHFCVITFRVSHLKEACRHVSNFSSLTSSAGKACMSCATVGLSLSAWEVRN